MFQDKLIASLWVIIIFFDCVTMILKPRQMWWYPIYTIFIGAVATAVIIANYAVVR